MIEIWLPSIARWKVSATIRPPTPASRPLLNSASRSGIASGASLVWFGGFLAGAYRSAGRIDEARGAAEEALSLSEELRHPWAVALARRGLGRIDLVAGELAGAECHLSKALRCSPEWSCPSRSRSRASTWPSSRAVGAIWRPRTSTSGAAGRAYGVGSPGVSGPPRPPGPSARGILRRGRSRRRAVARHRPSITRRRAERRWSRGRMRQPDNGTSSTTPDPHLEVRRDRRAHVGRADHTKVRILDEGRSLAFVILLGLPGDARA